MSEIIDGYCQCGCGELTNIYRGKSRKFIKGHQARGKNNSRFGVVLSDEIKKKISDIRKEQGNPWWIGRSHKDFSKKKMSEMRKGIATTPRQGINKNCIYCDKLFYLAQCKKDISFYCSKECQNKDYSKRFFGENNPFYGKKHTEKVKELLRQYAAKQRSLTPVLPTKPEKAIHNELIKLDIKFQSEYLINNKFCVDVFIPSYNLIIYIDGCYWHACPIHFSKAQKPKSDNARIPYLTKCGFNVEIIWEHDINERLDEVIKNICLKYNIKN